MQSERKWVNILMATYNGGKYLENQILSLIGQTYKNWKLIIHDDGSSDQTLDIIRRYSLFDHRVFLVEDNISFRSASANFVHLLKFATDDYVIFCDQDDFWFESKLELLVIEMQKLQKPGAVYCNAYLYNGTTIIGDKTTLIHRDSVENSIFMNSGVQGCSLMFSRSLLNTFKIPEIVAMHDHLITMAAVCFGSLKYLDASLMLYRQHDQNVTGNIDISFLSRLIGFITTKRAVLDKSHFEANCSFYEMNKYTMDRHTSSLFQAYMLFPNQNLIERILSIVRHRFSVGTQLTLIIKTILRKPI